MKLLGLGVRVIRLKSGGQNRSTSSRCPPEIQEPLPCCPKKRFWTFKRVLGFSTVSMRCPLSPELHSLSSNHYNGDLTVPPAFTFLFLSFFQLTFGAGVYTGIYVSQNYEVPRVDDPQKLVQRLNEKVKELVDQSKNK
ncbi:hypothetical protein M5D96_011546 [Drosophila gunungcola]|uniref:Uncharacterized protein n=1 Tax=Drosophila gunungcola TaxID=103775 RepID=A0A9P9YEU9_9MUSC|nr:hypothetical protein M5D96_011546 [Drosophila gunungcola]